MSTAMLRRCALTCVARRDRPARRRHRLVVSCGLLVGLLLPWPLFAQVPRNVLVLTSEETSSPSLGLIVGRLESDLRAAAGPVNIYVESLERSRFPAGHEKFVELFKQRYSDRPLDLVITICAPALEFALRYRYSYFRGTPILFGFVDRAMVSALGPPPDISGVYFDPHFDALIGLALKLHPATHTLVVVNGSSEFDRSWRPALDRAVESAASRVAVRREYDVTLHDLLGDLSTLPDGSVVFYSSLSRDAAGNAFLPRDVLDMIRRVTLAPLYGTGTASLGHGIVGGPMLDLEAHGDDLARMAARVLAGERADSIEPVTTANRLAFDWRELQRFRISEGALPAGAAIVYRDRGFWTVHQGWIIATGVLLGAQSVLIALLLAHRRKRASLQASLAGRLRLERLVSEVSTALGGAAVVRMDTAIAAAIGVIRQHLQIDRVSLFELAGDRVVRTADDAAPGTPPMTDAYEQASVPSMVLALAALQPFLVERLEDLPEEAVGERALMQSGDIRSLALIPLEVGGLGMGVLSCVSHRRRVVWTADLVQQLRTLGQLFANVLQRRRTEAAIGESDRLKGAILSSFPAHIAVLDRRGVIISVNEAWTAFGRQNKVASEAAIGPGVNYLAVCERAADAVPEVADVAVGIRTVCEGQSQSYSTEYACPCPSGERWFALRVVPLRRTEGGAVVTHRDITGEKAQELALRESEQRFRLLADALPVSVWMSGLDKGCTYFNQEWLDFAGRPMDEELGDGWVERVHPDDADRVVREYFLAFDAREAFSVEYRLRRWDGAYRWVIDQGTPRYDAAGVFHGFVGGCVDITERTEAEQRQRDLSGRLITAQEDERRRIARELHDDLQQRLALLAIELDMLALGPPPAGDEIKERARALWKHAAEISSDVHRLSHRLHPSKLEALGLLATVQSYCRELSQHGLQVSFTHDGVPQDIPADVALCVFRVVQESLQNVAKHSGATEANVAMSGADGRLHLVVSDAGRGFDVDAAFNRGGLGLVSMLERLHLVGGTMSLQSREGGGTSVEFHVPLRGEGGGVEARDAAGMRA